MNPINAIPALAILVLIFILSYRRFTKALNLESAKANESAVGRFAKTILIFVCLGPPVGFAVFIALGQMQLGKSIPLGASTEYFFAFLSIAYIIGMPYLVSAGFAAASIAAILKAQPLWIGPLSGFLSIGLHHILPRSKVFFDKNMSMVLLIHILSATVCWIVVKGPSSR